MRKLATIAFGLSLLLPTLQYEAGLFNRVALALNGDTAAMAPTDLHPPVAVSEGLAKLTSFVRSGLQLS